MRQIPFKVSAKAARLIGRENVSSADGALIELIKNCYDADAKHAFVIFDIKYDAVPESIEFEKFQKLCTDISFKEKFSTFYQKNTKDYSLLEPINDAIYAQLMDFFNQYNRIYIVDDGEGMAESCIEDKWMTIGTNNKEENYQTPSGRVRVGAKGIGRFALDRLGEYSSMITQKTGNPCCDWLIEWNSFEGEEKSIDQVQASLSTLDSEYSEYVEKLIKEYVSYDFLGDLDINNISFCSGTALEISFLRDIWDKNRILNLFRAIKTLVPPVENSEFRLFIIQTNTDNSLLGEVKSYLCDDYDYKLNVNCLDPEHVDLKLSRNEFDLSRMPQDLLSILSQKVEGFTEDSISKTIPITNIIGNSDIDLSIFNQIGRFSLDFYFLKRSFTRRDNAKFYYKYFNSSDRTALLDTFGGIKIFRDNFRVRPYGEKGGDSFDWLELGSRQAESPAAPTHYNGQWRVRPGQVTGSIHISRLNNLQFRDKSSREGILHNDTFDAFKALICSIIEIFEKDRQKIFRILDEYFKLNNRNQVNTEKANQIVKQVQSDNESSEKEKILVDAFLHKQDELEKALSENQLLRRYGSVGLTISSLAHELSNTILKLSPTTTVLQKYISIGIEDKTLGIEGFKKLDYNCTQLQEQHKRIKSWSDFSLNSINRDKRTQQTKDLYKYFSDLKESWIGILSDKSIEINVPEAKSLTERFLKKMFVIDFDSIFNNLIINSIYAMTKRKDAPPERTIDIDFAEENGILQIIYEDTGPGLEDSIEDSEEIFAPLFSTKTDRLGKKIGSGLGMWIIKSIVNDNNGNILILKARPGFRVQLEFPINQKEGRRG